MARKVETNFRVEFYQKKESLATMTHTIQDKVSKTDLDTEIEFETYSKLEKIVIDKAWFSRYCGAFAVVFKSGSKIPYMLIVYKPSFQYQVITNRRKIRDELIYLKSSVQV